MRVKRDLINGYLKDRGYTTDEFAKVLNLNKVKLNNVLNGNKLTYEQELALLRYFTPTVAQFFMIFEEADYVGMKSWGINE